MDLVIIVTVNWLGQPLRFNISKFQYTIKPTISHWGYILKNHLCQTQFLFKTVIQVPEFY